MWNSMEPIDSIFESSKVIKSNLLTELFINMSESARYVQIGVVGSYAYTNGWVVCFSCVTSALNSKLLLLGYLSIGCEG